MSRKKASHTISKDEEELVILTARYLGISAKKLLNESVEDAERRTNYKKKPIDTSILSQNYIARRGFVPYPQITNNEIKRMRRSVLSH